MALAAALQRVHTFGDIWTEIARAVGAGDRCDGAVPRSVLDELWALTVGILVRSLQAAAALAVAMDARGFATAYRRTWAAPAPWRLADWLVVLASLVPVVVAAGLR